MDKVLVLGINGFTGRHFQDYIARNNLPECFSFFGVDSSVERLSPINYIRMDLLKFKKVESLLLRIKPDYIINFAGTYDHGNFDRMLNVNAEISRNVLEVIARNKLSVKKILLIGSAAEYGKTKKMPVREGLPLLPVSLYGLSKSIQSMYAEYYAKNHNINVSIARTFNIIGKGIPKSLCVGSFAAQIKKAKNKDTIFTGNLRTKRDFLDIEDVVDAYWKILLRGKRRETYNVCSGRSYCIKDILGYLIRDSGKKIKVATKKEFVRRNDISDIFGDNRKLRKDTGWIERKNIFEALSRALEN